MNIYLVKDGIQNIGCISKNGIQIKGTNFYLITYDFESNEGYIDKKGSNNWLLYTQIGQILNKSRYHRFNTFEKCLNKLKELKGNDKIFICNEEDVRKIIIE